MSLPRNVETGSGLLSLNRENRSGLRLVFATLSTLRKMTRRDLVSLVHHLFPKFLERMNFLRNREAFRGTIVDIGCGHQPYARMLADATTRYVGIDSTIAVEPDVVADATLLPFSAASCDVVLCMQVLEHVAFPERLLRDAAEILRPGGVIYVTVPMTWGLHYEPNDYRRFTSHGLLAMLSSARYEVLEVRCYGGIFSVIGALLADWIYERVRSGLFLLPYRIRLVCALGAAFLTSFLFIVPALLLDRFDRRHALGWIATARKPSCE